MDGLSALSVAASVAQFIEFGSSLVSKSKEIYQSANGLQIQHAEAATAARRVTELGERIKLARQVERPGMTDADEQALEVICEGCISVSKELLSKLEKLKVGGGSKHRMFKSFRQALKSVWSKEAVDEIARRLEAFQRELDAHLLVSLSEKFNNLTILHDKSFGSLDQQLRQSIKTFLPYLVDIHNKMKEVMDLQRKVLDLHQRERLINEHKDELVDATRKRDEAYQKADALLLQELWFPEISHRHLEIEEAHRQTFAWLLKHNSADCLCAKPGSEGRMWHNFTKWLQESGNLYWINGKAGSGKSTLMRYICDNDITRQYLESWAGASRLQMASFYFWNSGSKEQHSQTGLLRSLLYQILKGRTDIIRSVFEEEWDYFVSQRLEASRFWSFPKLEKAFLETVRLIGDESKTCIFVDGLDEFEGDPERLITLVKKISELPNIKICLSSRPWIMFEEHFEGYPGLRLQDLTYDDIRLYVRDRLEENSKMQHLAKSQLLQTAALIHNIVTKANGVFLWVKLVVWSLLDGLRKRDDIPELQKRLDSIPQNLDALYRHLLQRIDPLYITQACRIFRIFNAVSDLQIQPTVLELDLAVTATYADAMNPSRVVMSDQEISQRCDRMSAHLKTRCEGLLEVHDLRDQHWEGIEHPRCDYLQHDIFPIDENEAHLRLRQRVKADLRVTYLHRTVRDFFAVDSVREILLDQTGAKAQFEPHISLLMGYVINLRQDVRSFYGTAKISHEQLTWTVMSDALLIAQRVNCELVHLRDSMLNEFSNLTFRWVHLPHRGANAYHRWTMQEWNAAVLSATVIFGLTSFVENSLMRNSNTLQGTDGVSLLAIALGFPMNLWVLGWKKNPIRDTHQPVFPSMVNLLLRSGADPNEVNKCSGTLSMWQFALYSYYFALSLPGSKESEQETDWAEIVKAVLEHGGDRKVKYSQYHHHELVHQWDFESSLDLGRDDFEKYTSHHGRPLLQLINDLLLKKGCTPLDESLSEKISSTTVKSIPARSISPKRPRSASPSHLSGIGAGTLSGRKHAGFIQPEALPGPKRHCTSEFKLDAS